MAPTTSGSLEVGATSADAIRVILTQHPRGLKPAEVAGFMDRGGFENKGATPLPTRVRNELWRMASKGALRSVKGRYYLPADSEAE